MKLFVYMDNIDFISPDCEATDRVLSEVSRISATLGFRVNNAKKGGYTNGPPPLPMKPDSQRSAPQGPSSITSVLGAHHASPLFGPQGQK